MKMASIAILAPSATVLVGTALACSCPPAYARRREPGRARLQRDPLRVLVGVEQQRLRVRRPHGERAVLDAVVTGVAMLVGRYWVIVPVLALAGSLARKKLVAAGAGTLPTHGPLFVALLVGDGAPRRRAHVHPRARARARSSSTSSSLAR